MTTQLSVKRLTHSDLTLFKSYFYDQKASGHSESKQKGINLNADVFIGEHYPQLAAIAALTEHRVPLDTYFQGPGIQPILNLQRKALKPKGAKNWRLNGELVEDNDNPDRFRPLSPGDLALFEFNGQPAPTNLRLFLFSRNVVEDASAHGVLDVWLGDRKMAAIKGRELEQLLSSVV